jgi:hypothetical protein
MEQFEKIFRACNRLSNSEDVRLSFNGSEFAFIVNAKILCVDADMERLASKAKNYLVENFLDMALSTPTKAKEQKATPKITVGSGDMKTRSDWSVGTKGDPRKGRMRGRSRNRKAFNKTQIIAFMRKRFNGRFSSELVSYDQYCEEFIKEHKRADNREWWRTNRGKGKYDETSIRMRVKK